MTVENVLKLLKLYKEKGNRKGYEMLRAHVNDPKGRKFRGLNVEPFDAQPESPKETEVKDEKPKRRTRASVGDNELDE